MDVPADLAPVVACLPEPVIDLGQQLAGPGRPWLVRYGRAQAILRSSDPRRFKRAAFSPDVARASIEWLHDYLRDLAATGYVAPAPVADLHGESIVVIDGVIWELLTFVPGRPMRWTDDLQEAGRALARFHEASGSTPGRAQRPGAAALRESRPSHPDAEPVRASVDHALATIGDQPRLVIHGDATQANVVIEDGAYRLVDFALAYRESALADIGSALWRNARTDPDSLVYDAGRLGRFVRGYAGVLPQPIAAGRAIVQLMLARGLQLQHRLELREGSDPSIMRRLLAASAQQDELQRAAEAGIA